MYAGAVRETVFCDPDVVKRVKTDFVALALKATLVNGVSKTPDEDESRLYARLKRAMLAPQGVGVLDGDGRILAWIQMFEGQRRIPAFFDHALKLHAAKPAKTERYQIFPIDRHKDLDDQPPASIAEAHAKGTRCPARAAAKSAASRGSVVCRLYGRALDADGKLVADTVRQEHYVQEQFVIDPDLQAAIARALAGDGRLPDDFGKLVATYAHLGHIDVRPLFDMNVGRLLRNEFKATKAGAGWRLEGATEVTSEQRCNGTGGHDVKLAWTGFVEFDGSRLTRLLLSARGTERLKFENGGRGDEARNLPGGRCIDQDTGVRYGIVGEPVADGDAVEPALGPDAIMAKMKKVGPLLEKRQKSGKDMQPVAKIMDRFQKLMDEGKFPEASKALDEVLQLLDDKGSQVIPWEKDLAAAMNRAKEEKKLVLQFLMLGDLDDPNC